MVRFLVSSGKVSLTALNNPDLYFLGLFRIDGPLRGWTRVSCGGAAFIDMFLLI